MSAAKKLTLKSLAEEWEKLKEGSSSRPLKQNIFELEDQLKEVNSDREKSCTQKMPSICWIFKGIKRHIKEHQIAKIKCEYFLMILSQLKVISKQT